MVRDVKFDGDQRDGTRFWPTTARPLQLEIIRRVGKFPVLVCGKEPDQAPSWFPFSFGHVFLGGFLGGGGAIGAFA